MAKGEVIELVGLAVNVMKLLKYLILLPTSTLSPKCLIILTLLVPALPIMVIKNSYRKACSHNYSKHPYSRYNKL